MTSPQPQQVPVRLVRTEDLGAADLAQLLDLFRACWPDGGFTTDDIAHAMGGVHWLAEEGGRIVGHASVVPRLLEADGVPLATGYVEAVATHPDWRHRGIASRLMEQANAYVSETFELGALSTDLHLVYARVGWEHWRGPTFVRTDAGPVRTPDEDDGIMILRTPRTPPLAGTESLSCEWRAGDAW
ncbi:MAG TPA: GNAT family N-acetyltransferase [Candidatus Limnocylindrales bacterium]|nr:GNAT family N-acetyltransferase [Candidatus Limnocylindrales bacterium]